MKSVLCGVSKSDIIRDPFPHIVIKNAIDPALADKLLLEYPHVDDLGKGRQGLTKNGKMPNNIKLRYQSVDVRNDPALSPLWKEFIETHVSGDFFLDFLKIFKEDLISLHPQISELLSSITAHDVGVQHIDSFPQKKILLNAEICADSPVVKESSVRGIHLDHPNKLGVALLYLKGKDNDAVGGEFELYKHVPGKSFVTNHIRNVKPRYLTDFERVKSVPYEHNTLLLFLNSNKSFHGVSPRKKTAYSRHAFDIAFDVNFPLFDMAPYTEDRWISRIREQYMKITGVHKEQVSWI